MIAMSAVTSARGELVYPSSSGRSPDCRESVPLRGGAGLPIPPSPRQLLSLKFPLKSISLLWLKRRRDKSRLARLPSSTNWRVKDLTPEGEE